MNGYVCLSKAKCNTYRRRRNGYLVQEYKKTQGGERLRLTGDERMDKIPIQERQIDYACGFQDDRWYHVCGGSSVWFFKRSVSKCFRCGKTQEQVRRTVIKRKKALVK